MFRACSIFSVKFFSYVILDSLIVFCGMNKTASRMLTGFHPGHVLSFGSTFVVELDGILGKRIGILAAVDHEDRLGQFIDPIDRAVVDLVTACDVLFELGQYPKSQTDRALLFDHVQFERLVEPGIHSL